LQKQLKQAAGGLSLIETVLRLRIRSPSRDEKTFKTTPNEFTAEAIDAISVNSNAEQIPTNVAARLSAGRRRAIEMFGAASNRTTI
jgi:hypothetical protein